MSSRRKPLLLPYHPISVARFGSADALTCLAWKQMHQEVPVKDFKTMFGGTDKACFSGRSAVVRKLNLCFRGRILVSVLPLVSLRIRKHNGPILHSQIMRML